MILLLNGMQIVLIKDRRDRLERVPAEEIADGLAGHRSRQ